MKHFLLVKLLDIKRKRETTLLQITCDRPERQADGSKIIAAKSRNQPASFALDRVGTRLVERFVVSKVAVDLRTRVGAHIDGNFLDRRKAGPAPGVNDRDTGVDPVAFAGQRV